MSLAGSLGLLVSQFAATGPPHESTPSLNGTVPRYGEPRIETLATSRGVGPTRGYRLWSTGKEPTPPFRLAGAQLIPPLPQAGPRARRVSARTPARLG